MSDTLPTVRVVNPAAPGEYKIINEFDLKPHHVLWSDGAAAPATPPANSSLPAPSSAPAALRDPLDHDGDGRKGGSAPLATAGKGPGGRWYVKRAKEIVSGPYPDESAATAAAEKENAS
jgi:hypothetical protein